ncbi:MAG: DNA-3-methyladenine glycosylase [Pedobacter sp.]|nr:MAG: DNA-3-methyladenine glycosylase [Pedobacter sp.]
MAKLPYSFYQQHNVLDIARQLLGKQLFTHVNDVITAGTIVETEAYEGISDKASHAYGGRFTNRTKTMYATGGTAYVYLCYGIHDLFNVVTASEGTPHAVLIRGLEPVKGLEAMLERRKMPALKPNITAGPGALSKALGIDRNFNSEDLTGDRIWIDDNGIYFKTEEIVTGPRIGVDYAGDHAMLPYRFYVKGNQYVSKPHV